MPRVDITQYATAETRRKGALAATAARVERAKPVRQQIAELLQAEVQSGFASAKKAWTEGDWRAWHGTMDQAFGKPDGHMSLDIAGSLEVEHSRRLTLADVAALTAELGAVQPALEPPSDG